MSVFDHKLIYPGGDCCGYCLDEWPCLMGRARIEVAAAIRAMPDTFTGNGVYDEGKDAGRESAADMVEGV